MARADMPAASLLSGVMALGFVPLCPTTENNSWRQREPPFHLAQGLVGPSVPPFCVSTPWPNPDRLPTP